MANLSELPHDMLVVISKLLKKLEDFVSFRCVSKSLYAAAKDEYFEGLRLRHHLLLPVKDDDSDDVRELYSLVEGESIVGSVKVAKFKGKKCFESLGWLLAVEGDGNMALLDPLSGSEIPLPHQNTYPDYERCRMEEHMFMQKMVLSARPSETSDFILMVICGRFGDLAFWRLGDKAWKRIKLRAGRFCDVVYHDNGKFYAIGYPGIVSVDLRLAEEEGYSVRGGCVQLVAPYNILSYLCPDFQRMKSYILKAVDGSFLIIMRTSPKLSEDVSSYITTKFQVYEVDRAKESAKEIYSLGSMAVFVGGHNSTIALDASRFPGGAIKANHIYFPDDDWGGVYNLEMGTIEPFYPGRSKVSTSLWINPPCLYRSQSAYYQLNWVALMKVFLAA